MYADNQKDKQKKGPTRGFTEISIENPRLKFIFGGTFGLEDKLPKSVFETLIETSLRPLQGEAEESISYNHLQYPLRKGVSCSLLATLSTSDWGKWITETN